MAGPRAGSPPQGPSSVAKRVRLAKRGETLFEVLVAGGGHNLRLRKRRDPYMTNTRKKLARALAAKTGMSYQAALQAGLRGKTKPEEAPLPKAPEPLLNAEVPNEAFSPPEKPTLGFRQWLKQFKEDDTPRGDLAREVDDDRRGAVVRGPSSRDGWVGYLRSRGAAHQVVQVMEGAWDEYDAYKRQNERPREATPFERVTASLEKMRKSATPLEKMVESIEKTATPFEKMQRLVAPPGSVTKMMDSIGKLTPRMPVVDRFQETMETLRESRGGVVPPSFPRRPVKTRRRPKGR